MTCSPARNGRRAWPLNSVVRRQIMITTMRHELAKNAFYGIQLCVFEVLWPAVPELKQLFIREKPTGFDVYFRFDQLTNPRDEESCERLMQEVIDAAFPVRRRKTRYLFGTSTPTGRFRELMSSQIFERIAAEHAPWRLKGGR